VNDRTKPHAGVPVCDMFEGLAGDTETTVR
jgi:hypothetical protein